jgi:hypothetical protein
MPRYFQRISKLAGLVTSWQAGRTPAGDEVAVKYPNAND